MGEESASQARIRRAASRRSLAEVHLLNARIARKKLSERTCVYCGHKALLAPKRDWPDVCRLHADLPFVDPAYPHIVAALTSGEIDTLRS